MKYARTGPGLACSTSPREPRLYECEILHSLRYAWPINSSKFNKKYIYQNIVQRITGTHQFAHHIYGIIACNLANLNLHLFCIYIVIYNLKYIYYKYLILQWKYIHI